MLKETRPIGIFDSGVGGVSVLRELVSLMPEENFIYLGDSKNAPYGTKSHNEIFIHAGECARYLAQRDIKALVVACNTATGVCIEHLRTEYPDMPVVGIEPALKPAVLWKPNSTVAVMATPLTLEESKFLELCKDYSAMANIIPVPCPGLMELVEHGLADSRETEEFLTERFSSVPKPDSIVLGCTHYPFIRKALSRVLPDVRIFDGGEGTARQVMRLLKKDGLLSNTGKKGSIIFENTLSDDGINLLARKLLDCEI